jgi:type I restriction enzyme S subunit
MAGDSVHPATLLGQVAKITMGQSPPGTTYNETGEGLPFYQGVADFGARYPLRRVYCSAPTRFAEKGDILLSVRAPIGRVNRASEKCAIGRGLAAVRGETERDTTYIELLLRASAHLWGILEGQGSVFGNAKREDLESLPLMWPDRSIRHAIAHVLGTLDDKIELNRRMNETLEAIARAIFKSWFVDFDPVRAKTEGRWRKGQSLPGLPAALWDLFPDHYVNSELGGIPAGWAVKTIEDVSERVSMGPFGSSIKVETFVPKGVPIISGQHLGGFVMEDNTFNFITQEHAKRLSNAVVQRGDVIFTHAGNIGQAAFIPKTSRYERYVISQRQFYMRCDLSQVTPAFIALYFNSPEGQHKLLANTSSSGVPSIARPVTYLRSIQIPLPQRAVMDAFDRIVSVVVLRLRQNKVSNGTLATLHDALLPKLVSGELQVRDPERFIGRYV